MKDNQITVSMYVQWYGRTFGEEHHGNIHGTSPQDCMAQLRAFIGSLDLDKYTKPEILFIY